MSDRTTPSSLPATPRRWQALALGAFVGAGGMFAAMRWFDNSDAEDQIAEEAATLATVEASTADLIEEIEWDGMLDYGEQMVIAGTSGTVTGAVEVGTLIGHGDAVVEVDAVPRVVFFGEVPLYRTMSEGTEGPDVFELESNLAALGFDPNQTVTIDETFTAYSSLMVQRWQESLGVEATGEVRASDAIVLSGPVVVLATPVVGAAATGPLVTVAPQSDLRVTVPVAVADADDWREGDAITVVLADESQQAGTVAVVGTALTTNQTGSTVDVTIELEGDTSGLPEGPVTVRTTGDSVLGATVVPTRALVALREGGFAVEIVGSDGVPRLVGVEIGAFDDGIVEVTNGSVEPGELVVVPQ